MTTAVQNVWIYCRAVEARKRPQESFRDSYSPKISRTTLDFAPPAPVNSVDKSLWSDIRHAMLTSHKQESSRLMQQRAMDPLPSHIGQLSGLPDYHQVGLQLLLHCQYMAATMSWITFDGYSAALADPYDPIFLQCFDTVGWVIWPVKTHLQYDLCVWWDVKPYST